MAGIGIFLGAFNPMHLSHVRIARELLKTRGLDRVYIHCLVDPDQERDAPLSDFHSGDEVYAYETRRELARLVLAECGGDPRLVLLDLPTVYARDGFSGVVAQIRALHPDAPLHGVHGDDAGGLHVRALYEREGIEPYQVARTDQISATSIRTGASGMTTRGVDEALACLRAGAMAFSVNGQYYRFDGHRLMRAVSGARRLASF